MLGVKPPPAVLVHAEIMPVTDKRARGLEYSMLLLRNVFHVFYNQCHYSYIYILLGFLIFAASLSIILSLV